MYGCLHLAKSSSDPVKLAMATWENIAVLSILFGCESLLFSEAKLLELERVEARVAKAILGVPKSTASICAQSELGLKPIRMRIFQQQLRFYFKTLSLPSGRWVKAALLDHLSGLWKSSYIAYICKLQTNVNLQDTPPSLRYLDKHIHHWALARVNEGIRKLQLPCIEPLF